MKTLVPLPAFILLCCLSVGAQVPDRQLAGERVQRALSDPQCKESQRAVGYEWFLDAIKKGERGDGVHYPWMDKMRQLGIKQVFFVVRFEWKNGEYRYKVKRIAYLRRYYCHEDEVKGGEILRQIRESGLEEELKEAIIAKVRKYELPYRPEYVKSGESYHYLLDDEYLPVIDFVT